MLHDLAEYFADLDTVLSQPTRAAIVRRFCHLATQKLKESGDPEAYRNWLSGGKARFVRDCGIKEGLQAIAANLALSPTALSDYCTRWLEATQYKADSDADWRTFTPEQNHLRVAMLRQLVAKSKGIDTPCLTSAK